MTAVLLHLWVPWGMGGLAAAAAGELAAGEPLVVVVVGLSVGLGQVGRGSWCM